MGQDALPVRGFSTRGGPADRMSNPCEMSQPPPIGTDRATPGWRLVAKANRRSWRGARCRAATLTACQNSDIRKRFPAPKKVQGGAKSDPPDRLAAMERSRSHDVPPGGRKGKAWPPPPTEPPRRLAVVLFLAVFAFTQPPLVFWLGNRVEPWVFGVPFLYAYLLVFYVLSIGVLIWARRRGL